MNETPAPQGLSDATPPQSPPETTPVVAMPLPEKPFVPLSETGQPPVVTSEIPAVTTEVTTAPEGDTHDSKDGHSGHEDDKSVDAWKVASGEASTADSSANKTDMVTPEVAPAVNPMNLPDSGINSEEPTGNTATPVTIPISSDVIDTVVVTPISEKTISTDVPAPENPSATSEQAPTPDNVLDISVALKKKIEEMKHTVTTGEATIADIDREMNELAAKKEKVKAEIAKDQKLLPSYEEAYSRISDAEAAATEPAKAA